MNTSRVPGAFGGVLHQGYELGDVDLSQVGAQIITDALARMTPTWSPTCSGSDASTATFNWPALLTCGM